MLHRGSLTRLLGLLLAVAILCALGMGCAREGKKGQLSGQVIFRGKPVPAGWISFMPDASVPGGSVRSAQIKDGRYDTAQSSSPGVFAGPNLIRIAGFDGKPVVGYAQGKQIFNIYELHETLAEGAVVKDFVVPPSAADNLKIEPTADP